MKKVIVTGGSGFLGSYLIRNLIKKDIEIYAVVRSARKLELRVNDLKNINIVELDMMNIADLPSLIHEKCDTFYHLAWRGERNAFEEQTDNIHYVVEALEVAAKLGCKKFICTGSQAEYGIYRTQTDETTLPNPNTAYGAAKLAACYLTKFRAEQLKIEWIWARVFSVYGKNDNPKALIPYLIQTLQAGISPKVSAGLQQWDFLHGNDAADALIALGETDGVQGIYHIASGDSKPLRYFIEAVRDSIAPEQTIQYDTVATGGVELFTSIDKIKKTTGWTPKLKFFDGIYDILK